MRGSPKIFTALLLLMLLLFHLQQHIEFPRLKQLRGAFHQSEFPSLSWESWTNGDFQSAFEAYQKDHLGYRPSLIRIHNQLHYSLFDKIHHKDIFRGKSEHLLGQEYVDSYRAKDLEKDSVVNARAANLALLNQYLLKNKKMMLVVFAPDKAFAMPEEFGLSPNEQQPSNSTKWRQALANNAIPYIDFRRHFKSLVDTSAYPVFTKTGIHWNVWGMRNAADSIAGFINAHSSYQLPRMMVEANMWTNDYPPIEKDLENALNLWLPLEKEEMPYQRYKMDSSGSKPKVLVISDSFFYEMYSGGLANQFFDAPFFWYYNTTALKYDWEDAPRNPKEYALDSLMQETDIVVLMSSATNLKDFPWAFDARVAKTQF